jgi:hypothetical protein
MNKLTKCKKIKSRENRRYKIKIYLKIERKDQNAYKMWIIQG